MLLFGYLFLSCFSGCKVINSNSDPISLPAKFVTGDPDNTDVEYSVLSVAIRYHYRYYMPPVIVVNQKSFHGWISTSQLPSVFYPVADSDNSKGIRYYRLESFNNSEISKTINSTSSFGSHFDLSRPYLVLAAAESDEIFKPDEHGWNRFYERFPGAGGLLVISRVAFNTDHTQAVLMVGSQHDYLAGSGDWLLLAKQNGLWIVVGQHNAWIS